MAEIDRIDEFGDQIAALEETLAGAQSVASTFSGALEQISTTMADTGREVRSLSTGIGRGLKGAFDGLIFDGMKASDALRQVGKSVLNATYSSAVNPVAQHLGKIAGAGIQSLIGAATPFAKGGAFTQGRVMPFARGGVVSGATTFPMRGGTGLMGEAGPEAIVPLARGADGRLGVRAAGQARPATVVMNVSTTDAASFQRSQSQIAAQMGRALSRGQRNR